MAGAAAGGAAGAIGKIAATVIENTGITKTDQTSNTAMDQLVNNLLNQQGTAETTQSGVVKTDQMSEKQTLNLENLLQQATGLISGVDPEAARNAAVAETLKSGIGKVIESGQNQGAFDSTAQSTAATRLSGEAATKGAAQELTANLGQQQNMAQLAASLNEILKGGSVTASSAQTGSEKTTGTQSSSQQTTGTTKETADQTVSKELTPQKDIIEQALKGAGFDLGTDDKGNFTIKDALDPFPENPTDSLEGLIGIGGGGDIKDKIKIKNPF